MRRALSIFLILLFGLAPLAAALPGSEDLRLPPCCRRNGAHHCAMSMQMTNQIASLMALAASGKSIVRAPLTCPFYPAYGAASTATAYALSAAAACLPVLPAQPHSPAAGRAAARLRQIRTHAGRGPPTTIFG